MHVHLANRSEYQASESIASFGPILAEIDCGVIMHKTVRHNVILRWRGKARKCRDISNGLLVDAVLF
jgi:hypothetical protein